MGTEAAHGEAAYGVDDIRRASDLSLALRRWHVDVDMPDDVIAEMRKFYRKALETVDTPAWDRLYRGLLFEPVRNVTGFVRDYLIGDRTPSMLRGHIGMDSWTTRYGIAKRFAKYGETDSIGVVLERDDVRKGDDRNVLFVVNTVKRYMALTVDGFIRGSPTRESGILADARQVARYVDDISDFENEVLLEIGPCCPFERVAGIFTTAAVTAPFLEIGWTVEGDHENAFEYRLDHGSRTLRARRGIGWTR